MTSIAFTYICLIVVSIAFKFLPRYASCLTSIKVFLYAAVCLRTLKTNCLRPLKTYCVPAIFTPFVRHAKTLVHTHGPLRSAQTQRRDYAIVSHHS